MKENLEVAYDELKAIRDSIKLLIVTANDIETYHVRQVLRNMNAYGDVLQVPRKLQTYFVGTFGVYNAVHVQCQKMGAVSSGASLTTVMNAIDDWQPKVILMIGVAMGVNEGKQNIGDVLVSETIAPYENQRLGVKGINQRSPIVEGGALLLNRFKHSNGWKNEIKEDVTIAKVRLGQILTGEKLIDNLSQRTKILKRFPNAIGAEMEGAGVYTACRDKNINEWILVKGICDYGDGNKGIDKENRQNIAAQSATSLCLKVFSSTVSFSDAGLIPITVSPNVSSIDAKPKILTKEILEIITHVKNMLTPIQNTVATFLSLNAIQKASVIKELGIALEELTNLNAHEMDREVFRQVKERNLFSVLWDAINKIKPFTKTLNNPFL